MITWMYYLGLVFLVISVLLIAFILVLSLNLNDFLSAFGQSNDRSILYNGGIPALILLILGIFLMKKSFKKTI